MKKVFMLSVLLVFAAVFCACGSSEDVKKSTAAESEASSAETTAAPETSAPETTAAAETISMYDLSKAMCAADPSLPEMSRISSSDTNAADLFTYFSKLDYEKVEAYYLCYAAKGTAEEIGVIALKDAKDADECKKSLEAHLQDRINLYKTYAPEQVKRAEKTTIFAEGRYVAFIMCDEQKAVTEAFHNFLEGK
ncbi:MAG: DUF4358 domain-containing protein [Lachnospiraceae bacterium]|nr:DUF4358 domain-containing protein [Lachnospiraceae bacterium]